MRSDLWPHSMVMHAHRDIAPPPGARQSTVRSLANFTLGFLASAEPFAVCSSSTLESVDSIGFCHTSFSPSPETCFRTESRDLNISATP